MPVWAGRAIRSPSLTRVNKMRANPLMVGLSAFYNFNEPTPLADSGPNALTLTNVGGVNFGPGVIGECPDNFLNNQTRHLDRADHAAMRIAGDKTIACWVNASSTAAIMGIINKGTGVGYSSSGGEWTLAYVNSGLDIRFGIRDANNSSADDVRHVVTLTTSAWHHIVATYVYSTKTATIRWNNSTQTSKVLAGITTPRTSTGTTTIGIWPGGGGWISKIGIVGLWDRVLTPAEITQLYNGGAGLEYPFR